MASVPNMRTAPPSPVPGIAPVADGEGGNLFASLLSLAPAGQTILDGPATTDGEAIPAIDAQIRPAAFDPAMVIDAGADTGKEDAEPARDDDDAVAPGLAPTAEIIPILHAQSSYPVIATVVAARVTHGSTSVTADVSPPAANASNAPQVALAAPDVQPDAETSKSGPRALAVPAETEGKDGGPAKEPALDLPASVKAALKARVRTKAAPADAAGVAARAEARAEAPRGDASNPAPAAAKGAMSSAAQATPIATTPSAAPPAVAVTLPAELPLQPAQPIRAAAPQPQAMNQAIEGELDLAQDSEWLDRLARDIARSGAADVPLRFKLHPQTLGHLRVELTQGDQGMIVRLTAETEAARVIIADAQPRLMQEARAQGVRIAHAEVDLAGNGHQSSSDSRRHEDGRPHVFIPTARGAGPDVVQAADPDRASSDRYA